MEDIKELRERTGAGVLDCKEALEETGEVDEAVEYLQKKGIEGAEEMSDRTASEGVIALWGNGFFTAASLVEVNCETDFAARQDTFTDFANQVARTAGKSSAGSVEELEGEEIENSEGVSVGEFREQEKAMTATLGENVRVRRVSSMGEVGYTVFTYIHSNDQIGAAVKLDPGDSSKNDEYEVREFGEGVAMHIAAMNPRFLSPENVPEDVAERREEIFEAQMKEKSKPDRIIPRIVEGKMDKWKSENSLRSQNYVKDDITVGEYEDSIEGVEIIDFVRLEVGEGIEEDDANFAKEVQEQL